MVDELMMNIIASSEMPSYEAFRSSAYHFDGSLDGGRAKLLVVDFESWLARKEKRTIKHLGVRKLEKCALLEGPTRL